MPRTKIQKLFYSCLTVFLTVHLFSYYNLALARGGMCNQIFLDAEKAVPILFIAAFLLETFIAGPISMKMALSVVNPQKDKPYIVTTVITCATITLMCPMMSLVTTMFFSGVNADLVAKWFEKVVINFPFAFFVQLFLIQPFVRFVFRSVFRKQLQVQGNGGVRQAV